MATAARRVSRDDGYGRSTRFYETADGQRLPSVTSILTTVNKPALVPWAAKMEREAVIKAAADLYEDLPAVRMNRMAYVSTLQNRLGKVKAHTKELAKAADIGSSVHERIEWDLRRDLKQSVGPEPVLQDKALWAYMAYEDWRKQANLVPYWIEQVVWSTSHGYAGTLDWWGEIGHNSERLRVVGDWKTGKAIYAEALLQNAAYVQALVEMGHATPPVAGCIVRLPKIENDPAFEVRIIPASLQPTLFQAFLHVLELWRWLESQ